MGAYTTHKILDGKKAIPLPDNITFEVAAACVVQGLTAHYLARSTYALQSGDWCVVHAAAGGVGQFLVQIAKLVGAKVIGTTSCDTKNRIALGLGCNECVHYHDLEDAVKEITNGLLCVLFVCVSAWFLHTALFFIAWKFLEISGLD